MRLISKYVRENKRYTKNELKKLFSLSDSEFTTFTNELINVNVLKKQGDDELEDDGEFFEEKLSSSNKTLYYFKYVGILLCQKRVIKVYPKCYIRLMEPVNDIDKRPDDQMKLVLSVIKKYNKRKNKTYFLQYPNEGYYKNNLLGLMIYLLDDYFEYGLYDNYEEIDEINGEGPINWNRTINECLPIIKSNMPYYFDTYTARNVNNEYDYFRMLHAYVLTECYRQLEEADLCDLFGISRVDLCDESLSFFGQSTFILNKIKQETNIQYETRKQQVLNALYTFIDEQYENRVDNVTESFKMYGTTAFNKVWETMCQTVFSDILHKPISQLPLKILPNEDSNSTLMDIIEKPKWVDESNVIYAKKTFEPDAVSICLLNGILSFVIMDAKYYNFQFEDGKILKGNPGVEDISKQYLYQLVYKDFINNHGITDVKNCFLFPTDKDEKELKGYAELDILHCLNLQNIKVRLLPIDYIMHLYLRSETLPISFLELEK